MKIYIDFDRTLFDTGSFMNDLDILYSKYQISNDLYQKYFEETRNEGFNPINILNLIKKEKSFDDNLFNELNNIILNGKKYLYHDSIPFLERARKKGYKIIILTRGNEEFQLKKIKGTDLYDYLDAILITLKHKGELDLDYRESLFIDDNPRELDSINTNNPKRIIRVLRDNTKYHDLVTNDIEIVKSLEEIAL